MLSESLAQAILAGNITGPELDTYLNTSEGYKAWGVLLKSRNLPIIFRNPDALALLFASGVALTGLLEINGAALAASDSATEAIAASSGALLTIVSDASLLNLWANNTGNKARMEAQVNAPGSKLVRVDYTSNGSYTYTVPAEGLVALGYFLTGGGGKGGDAYASRWAGTGGSGAEAVYGFITSGLPAGGTDINTTIGFQNQSSTITGIVTAAAGVQGSSSYGDSPGSNLNLGGGSDTGATPFDTDPLNALWQSNTGTRQGGRGGGRSGTNSQPSGGSPGSDGFPGLDGTGGGANGFLNGNNAGPASGGSGLCSGGGGGAVNQGYGANATTITTGFGCGGGGAGVGYISRNSNNFGSNGTKGLGVLHLILGEIA